MNKIYIVICLSNNEIMKTFTNKGNADSYRDSLNQRVSVGARFAVIERGIH